MKIHISWITRRRRRTARTSIWALLGSLVLQWFYWESWWGTVSPFHHTRFPPTEVCGWRRALGLKSTSTLASDCGQRRRSVPGTCLTPAWIQPDPPAAVWNTSVLCRHPWLITHTHTTHSALSTTWDSRRWISVTPESWLTDGSFTHAHTHTHYGFSGECHKVGWATCCLFWWLSDCGGL